MARSLVASPEGIEKARQALRRRSLTQKALAYEIAIASWATVSKFFNCKPIDRSIFLEICESLDLDWQDIVAPFLEEEEKTQHLLLTPIPPALEQLWQQLKALGSPTEQMGLVLAKEETLSWGWQTNSRYEKFVRVGSHIRFEVSLGNPGYLLLLQNDTSGQIWCFCPSCFAPEPHLNTGKTSLPQQGSPITSFPIEGTPGLEQILAVITKEEPTLDWLPQGSDEPLQLGENHLTQLLEYVNQSENCNVLYTDYQVIEREIPDFFKKSGI
jgi:DNA-binding Xre family transcriptional regulator